MCYTSLFRSGVDEQLIKKQTGHRSDTVRAYKRPSTEQDAMVSKILQPPEPKKPQLQKENIPPLESEPCTSASSDLKLPAEQTTSEHPSIQLPFGNGVNISLPSTTNNTVSLSPS